MSHDWHRIKRMMAREWLIFVGCLPLGFIVAPLFLALIFAWPDLIKPLTPLQKEIRTLIRDPHFQELSHSNQVVKLRQFLFEKKWPEVTAKMLLDPNLSSDEEIAIKEFRKAEEEKLPAELQPPPVDEILMQLNKTEDVLRAYSQNPYRRKIGKIYSGIGENFLTSVWILTLLAYVFIQFVRSMLWAIRITRRV